MNLSSGKDDANCCSNKEAPQKCCTDNAAEALVSIVNNGGTTNSASSPAKTTVGTKNKATKDKDNATGVITGDDGKPSICSRDDEKKSTTSLVVCPNKRRKRTVSVDFSNPCDCCPSETVNKAPQKAKTTASPAEVQQRTFVDDLAALAKFLKEEREFWMTTASCSSLLSSKSDEAFFQPSPQDTALVAEWRKSGRSVHTKLQEQVRRLKDMEAKFGAWETHHFDDDDDDKTEQT